MTRRSGRAGVAHLAVAGAAVYAALYATLSVWGAEHGLFQADGHVDAIAVALAGALLALRILLLVVLAPLALHHLVLRARVR